MLTPLINSATVDLILHWVPPFIFATIGVFLFWKTRPEYWPDFQKWDQKQEFELYEAACLWFDREPALPMPRNAQKKYQEWKRMILERRLSVTGQSLQDDIEISMKRESAINPHLVIRREVLKEVAENDNVEPRFLFPYRREGKMIHLTPIDRRSEDVRVLPIGRLLVDIQARRSRHIPQK